MDDTTSIKIVDSSGRNGINQVHDQNGIEMNKKELEEKEENKQQPTDDSIDNNNTVPKRDNTVRPLWSNKLEFLMSCISTSVGLGNIWRFPFIAYENGGGAFLIPYLICLFLIGKPIYYLEMAMGQFTSKASVRMYEFSSAFKGVGVGQLTGTACIISYYCSLIALTLYYFFASFSAELPWSRCLESWGTDCVDSSPFKHLTFHNTSVNGTRPASSSELYFLKDVLHEIDDISNGIGLPNWKLVLCLLGSWVVVFCVIVKGVKSSGKAAYFLALFPYIVMLVLLVRAVTLEGAVDGIIFFFKPQWGELLNPKVWKEAITQLFFSLAVGLGPIVMYASYNPFDHNIYRDAMIVTTLDTFTSLMAGVTIFGILGNLAFNLGIEDISDVVKSGTGLAFISYPDAISKFDVVPQIFSVLFFFMLFVLGIGSIVALICAIITVICDQFSTIKYWKVALCGCIFGFCIGLVYITPGGQWILNLIDYFGGTLLIFALTMFELPAIFWLYGIENFCWDIEFMLGRKTTLYWRICWTIVTPLFLIVVFFYSMANIERLQYSGWDYPDLVIGIGWGIFIIGFLQLPLWGFVSLLKKKSKKSFGQGFIGIFTPSRFWGPANEIKRMEWLQFKQDKLEQRIKLSSGHSYFKRTLFILLDKY